MFQAEGRTGDLARWAGMTTNGVRYLEKRGVVTSTRGENGYRAYDNASFLMAFAYQGLRATGMGERESAEALMQGPAELGQALDAWEQELRRQFEGRLDALRRERERLGSWGDEAAGAEAAPVQVRRVPSHAYVPLGRPDGDDDERASYADAMEWGRHANRMIPGMVMRLGAGGAWQTLRVHLASLDTVEAMGLASRHMTIVPERDCACVPFMLNEGEAETLDPAPVLANAGVEAPGVTELEVRICHFMREHGRLLGFAELLVPMTQ